MVSNISSLYFNVENKQRNNGVTFPTLEGKVKCTPIKNFDVSNKNKNVQAFGASNIIITPNTQLRNNDEVKKYTYVAQNLSKNNQKALNFLLKTGILLSDNSDDKSTTLDNLVNICATQRIRGLSPQIILNETVATIANPYIITQKFENIPKRIVKDVIEHENQEVAKISAINQANGKPIREGMINKDSLDVISSTCVAASIEFNLAKNQPAEFARMVSEVTSPKHSIEKTVDINNISKNMAEAMWLLKEFNVDFNSETMDKVRVKIFPDRNAIIRARIQTVDKDPLERSVVDVLLQSTFMNVGSQKTYNSLTDMRTGKYNPDPKGLTDIEKNLAEVLVTGKRKISVTYQNLDENGKIIGYECDFKTMFQQISDAVKLGENVIIGYTYTDENKVVQGGHEITIIDIVKDKNGKEYFVCNDTDDDKPEPITYPVESFLPKIHHAGLPREVLKEDVEFVQNWKEILKDYHEYRKSV